MLTGNRIRECLYTKGERREIYRESNIKYSRFRF